MFIVRLPHIWALCVFGLGLSAIFTLLSKHSAAILDKVYVYNVPEDILYQGHNMTFKTCPYSIYSSEIAVPELIRKHKRMVTSDPEKATAFIIPHCTSCFYHICLEQKEESAFECKIKAALYLQKIVAWTGEQHYYLTRKNGSDHAIVLSWDRGAELISVNADLVVRLQNFIHLVHGGYSNTNFEYRPQSYIVIPPYRQSDCSASEKNMFAYFRGTILEKYDYGRGIRNIIRQFGIDMPHLFEVYEGHNEFYWKEISSSIFALCPPGWSEWSPRFFDAIYCDTIPVLFGKLWELPFQDDVDYSKFVIYVQEPQIQNLPNILMGFSKKKLEEMRLHIKRFKYLLQYNDIQTHGEAIDLTLKSILKHSTKRLTSDRGLI